MYLAIIVIQLLVSVVVGVYFLRAIRKEKQGSPSGRNESSREMEKIRQLRQIHLNQPLGEQVRPRSFSDILRPKSAACDFVRPSWHRQDLCGKIGVGICKKTAGFCFSCRCAVCRNGRHLCSF